jgi:hypothetical protein
LFLASSIARSEFCRSRMREASALRVGGEVRRVRDSNSCYRSEDLRCENQICGHCGKPSPGQLPKSPAHSRAASDAPLARHFSPAMLRAAVGRRRNVKQPTECTRKRRFRTVPIAARNLHDRAVAVPEITGRENHPPTREVFLWGQSDDLGDSRHETGARPRAGGCESSYIPVLLRTPVQ